MGIHIALMGKPVILLVGMGPDGWDKEISVICINCITYLLVDMMCWDVCLKGGQDTK